MRRRVGWVWGGRVVAVVVVAGLAAYLSVVGLDKADKLASVLGLLVAVVALVAPYLLPIPEEHGDGPGPVQSVADTTVGGHLTQVRDAKAVRVHGPVTSGPSPGAPGGSRPGAEMPGGQYVNGVWVAGNLTQVDGSDGDVTVG